MRNLAAYLLILLLSPILAICQTNPWRDETTILRSIYSNPDVEPNYYVYAEFKAKGRKLDDSVDLTARLVIKNAFTGKTLREQLLSYSKEIRDSTYFEYRLNIEPRTLYYSSALKKIIIADKSGNINRIILLDGESMKPLDTILSTEKQYSRLAIDFFDKYMALTTFDSGAEVYEISSKFIKRDSIHFYYPYYKPDSFHIHREPTIGSIVFSGANAKPLLINTYAEGNNAIYRCKNFQRNEWELLDTMSIGSAISFDKSSNNIYYFKLKDSFYCLWKYDLSKKTKQVLVPQFLKQDYSINLILKTQSRNNFIFRYRDNYSPYSGKYVQKSDRQYNPNKDHLIEINLETMNKYTFNDRRIYAGPLFLRRDTLFCPEAEIVPDSVVMGYEKKTDWDSLLTYPLMGETLAGKKMPDIQLSDIKNDTIFYNNANPYIRLNGRISNNLSPENQLYINGREVNASPDFSELLDVNTCPDNLITFECFDKFDNHTSRIIFLKKEKPVDSQSDLLRIMGHSKSIALIIAEKDYENKADSLRNTINEAARLKDILLSKYNFSERNIYFRNDLKRGQVIKVLDSMSRNAGEFDQVLIFYTGHGIYDSTVDRGFWIPVDGTKEDQTNWYSNDDLLGAIKKIQAKHLFLLVDACYSGSVLEGRTKDPQGERLAFASLFTRKSRQALTSGALEKVPDKSKFMEAVLKQLESNTKQYYSASDLYNDIKDFVLSNTHTSPQYGILINTGSDGGEYFFIKK